MTIKIPIIFKNVKLQTTKVRYVWLHTTNNVTKSFSISPLEEKQTFQISVRSPLLSKTICLQLDPKASVAAVKALIQDKTGIKSESQHLYIKGNFEVLPVFLFCRLHWSVQMIDWQIMYNGANSIVVPARTLRKPYGWSFVRYCLFVKICAPQETY